LRRIKDLTSDDINEDVFAELEHLLARPEEFSLEALQEIGEGPALICNWEVIMLSSKT
jgi:hypothetical protein